MTSPELGTPRTSAVGHDAEADNLMGSRREEGTTRRAPQHRNVENALRSESGIRSASATGRRLLLKLAPKSVSRPKTLDMCAARSVDQGDGTSEYGKRYLRMNGLKRTSRRAEEPRVADESEHSWRRLRAVDTRAANDAQDALKDVPTQDDLHVTKLRW